MLAEKYAPKHLGVDVGFSTKRSTTAIAVLDGNEIHLVRAGTAWEDRVSQIPSGFRAVRFYDITLRVFEESRLRVGRPRDSKKKIPWFKILHRLHLLAGF